MIIQQREELKNEVKRYLSEITVINDYLSVYISVIDCINNPGNLRAINKAPAFFTLTISALKSSIIMGISRLYDTNKEAKTIGKLIRKCKNKKTLFPTVKRAEYIYDDKITQSEIINIRIDIERVLNELEQEEDRLKKSKIFEHIKMSRDKIYAHNDGKFFLDKASVPKIPIENIRELLGFATDTCNKILNALCGEVTATNSSNVDDLYKLLESVQGIDKVVD